MCWQCLFAIINHRPCTPMALQLRIDKRLPDKMENEIYKTKYNQYNNNYGKERPYGPLG